MKKILFAFIFLAHFSLKGQNNNCEVPSEISNGGLAIGFHNNKITNENYAELKAYFKMPATSNEVNKSDWISCKGFMPNGATIKSVEILSISGLPEGLSWNCDLENCFYKGKETGCVTFKGTAVKKGTYPIEINLKGIGSLWGIRKGYFCFIKTFEIIVE